MSGDILPRPGVLHGLHGDMLWQLVKQCLMRNPDDRPSTGSVEDTMATIQEEKAAPVERAQLPIFIPLDQDRDRPQISRPGTFSSPSALPQAPHVTLEVQPNASELLEELKRSEGCRELKDSKGFDQQEHLGQASDILVLSRSMPLSEIVSHMVRKGCPDLTNDLDMGTFPWIADSSGGSAWIYLGKLHDSTLVAVKVPGRSTTAAVSQMDTIREMHAWNKVHHFGQFQHPNIVPFLGLAFFRNRLSMVLPLLKNGHLRRFLARYPDTDRCILSAQICDGLSYLHDVGVVHGDMKGKNVLISDDGTPLLTDFGSVYMKDRSVSFTCVMNQFARTPRYAAPERFEDVETLATKEDDVHALGMTILAS
ncbi:unnamed protein product [Rhizoctonia solani]|uniref:Protein kinase domain-containing protein n=1 Tax=Rhizoctonia solani TaxID=456999 RepID=A0A8H3HTQ4_9AGAM|nr:unnamed protein product [Rhizoctonia solani]